MFILKSTTNIYINRLYIDIIPIYYMQLCKKRAEPSQVPLLNHEI